MKSTRCRSQMRSINLERPPDLVDGRGQRSSPGGSALSPSSICGEVDGEGDNVILAAQDVSFRHDDKSLVYTVSAVGFRANHSSP
jgi:hypothetical protein